MFNDNIISDIIKFVKLSFYNGRERTLMKKIRLLSILLAVLMLPLGVFVSCSAKELPQIYSYEDYGFRIDETTDLSTLDAKYLEQVKDQARLIYIGGEGTFDTESENVKGSLKDIETTARKLMSSMITAEKNPDRKSLWEGVSFEFMDDEAAEAKFMKGKEDDIRAHFDNLYKMAIAYATPGQSLYNTPKLRAALLDGIDFMMGVYNGYLDKYQYCNPRYIVEYRNTEYASSQTKQFSIWDGNWWEWDIGAPLSFLRTFIVLEDLFTPEQIKEYLHSFDFADYLPSMTGGNRAWITEAICLSAALQNDAKRFALALEKLESVFEYIDETGVVPEGAPTRDGFYLDGSFIQHIGHPYTAGYGMVMVTSLTNIFLFTNGTAFEMDEKYMNRQIEWAKNNFIPTVYNGAMVSTLRGRQVTRTHNEETEYGASLWISLIMLSTYPRISAEDKAYLLGTAKRWYAVVEIEDWETKGVGGYEYYQTIPLYVADYAKAAMTTKAVKTIDDYYQNVVFARMDRVVHHGETFGAALALSSERIAKYESINRENLEGWYMGDGALYIYSDSASEYNKAYWEALDWYKIPGTTVSTIKRYAGENSLPYATNAYAGGVSVGKYGAAAMQITPFTSTVVGEKLSLTLSAKKAYFFFDNEIVTLGTDINCTDKANVMTIIDNRLLGIDGKLTVNGSAAVLKSGTMREAPKAEYAHLSEFGGYYFPNSPALAYASEGSGNNGTIQLMIIHGKDVVEDESYECVYLPGMSEKETKKYSEKPEITILANDNGVQAVYDSSSGATGYIFWEGASAGAVKADTACAVMTQEEKKSFKVAISDPTQKSDTVTVTVTLPEGFTKAGACAENLSVSVNGDKATITANLSEHTGGSYEVIFE